jgi:hypothetical protein
MALQRVGWMTLFSSAKGAAAGGWVKRHPPYKLKRNLHLDIDENLLELELFIHGRGRKWWMDKASSTLRKLCGSG